MSRRPSAFDVRRAAARTAETTWRLTRGVPGSAEAIPEQPAQRFAWRPR
jgi:hypothetical protein